MITRFFGVSALMVVACMVAWIPAQAEERPVLKNDSEWLGRSYTELIHALGVPSAMTGRRAGSLELYYEKSKVGDGEPTVRLSGGVVLWVNPKGDLKFKRTLPPAKGAYVGQSVKELVERLGQPQEFTRGQISDIAVFADGLAVSLKDGMVMGLHQR